MFKKPIPVEEAQQRLQGDSDEGRVLRVFHDELAQLKDLRELRAHGVLEVLRLCLRHLPRGKVEHLFAQQLEDDHVVLAEALVGLARADDVRDEGLPVLGPLALQDLGAIV